MRGCGRNDGTGQACYRIERQDRHAAAALTGNGEMPGQTALSVRIENGKMPRPGAAGRGIADVSDGPGVLIDAKHRQRVIVVIGDEDKAAVG